MLYRVESLEDEELKNEWLEYIDWLEDIGYFSNATGLNFNIE